MSNSKIQLLGIHINPLTWKEFEQRISAILASRIRTIIMYVNIHCMNQGYRDEKYRTILNQSDIVYCDGEGVRIGAKTLGKHLPERMTGADWIYDLCALCESKGHSIYLLGAREGVADNAARILQTRYPGLIVAGTHHGYFKPSENRHLIDKINHAKPDILLVGMGTPIQEYWIDKNIKKLDVPIVWAMGAVMDFVSGNVPRAPAWMLNNGLEWFFRLAIEPGRMYKRYVIGNFLFFYRILKSKFRTSN
ncbi:MAG: WecB/TagA/CpsF family glycosyltransferase [Desulfobacteraceae bacterium]|nr:WecB/TagA/CpsF family glycosyltransferase [Desulfobacteraceae bacterium]